MSTISQQAAAAAVALSELCGTADTIERAEIIDRHFAPLLDAEHKRFNDTADQLIRTSDERESLRTQLEGVLRANKGLAEKVKRLESAGDGIAPWLSAALKDPKCCEEFKVAIRQWFKARP